jgi:hypothetical protein
MGHEEQSSWWRLRVRSGSRGGLRAGLIPPLTPLLRRAASVIALRVRPSEIRDYLPDTDS